MAASRGYCIIGHTARPLHHEVRLGKLSVFTRQFTSFSQTLFSSSSQGDKNYDPVLSEVKDPSHPYPGVGPVKGAPHDAAYGADVPDDHRGDELRWAEPKEVTMEKVEQITKETWETGGNKDARPLEPKD